MKALAKRSEKKYSKKNLKLAHLFSMSSDYKKLLIQQLQEYKSSLSLSNPLHHYAPIIKTSC